MDTRTVVTDPSWLHRVMVDPVTDITVPDTVDGEVDPVVEVVVLTVVGGVVAGVVVDVVAVVVVDVVVVTGAGVLTTSIATAARSAKFVGSGTPVTVTPLPTVIPVTPTVAPSFE